MKIVDTSSTAISEMLAAAVQSDPRSEEARVIASVMLRTLDDTTAEGLALIGVLVMFRSRIPGADEIIAELGRESDVQA